MKSLTKIHEANKQVPTENTNYSQSKLQCNLLYWATSLISHPSSAPCFPFSFSEMFLFSGSSSYNHYPYFFLCYIYRLTVL